LYSPPTPPTPFPYTTLFRSIEIGELPDSSQIARLLGLLPAYLYASPEYLQRHGAPRHPDDLTRHECLEFRAHDGKVTRWPLSRGDRKSTRLNSSHVKISYAV